MNVLQSTLSSCTLSGRSRIVKKFTWGFILFSFTPAPSHLMLYPLPPVLSCQIPILLVYVLRLDGNGNASREMGEFLEWPRCIE